MPGSHKNPTISFRPNSSWEMALIEQRAKLSGMYKKDFIVRSCIYANICVVGKRETIQRVVDALREMQIVMEEIAGQLMAGEFLLSDKAFKELREDYLALVITVVDIINGASYLFERIPDTDNQHWKADLEVEQMKKVLEEGQSRR